MSSAALREYFNRHVKPAQNKETVAGLLDGLFQQQLDVINEPSFFKVASCSRAAGKTYLCARYLVKTALEFPGSVSLYIALSLKRAKQLMIKEFRSLAASTGIEFEINLSELVVYFPNGSEIRLLGANNESLAENLRGDRYKLVVLDESGSYRGHLEYLLEDCVIPALLGPQGHGTLLMIGTPTARLAGPFYNACHATDGSYKHFHWTLKDNPFMPDVDAFLASILKRKKWTPDNPTFRREYCGFWEGGDDYLVYKYDPRKNSGVIPENKRFEYMLGVDFGSKDATAFVVGAHSDEDSNFYIIHAEKESNLDITDTANIIKKLQTRFNITRMVADCGALGKSIADELRRRHGLPIEAAKKTDKFAFIELMNSDLHEGRIKVSESCTALTSEWINLRKDPITGKEDDMDENHCADSALYMWRMSRHFWHEEKPKRADIGSETYWKQKEQENERQLLEQIESQKSSQWYEM